MASSGIFGRGCAVTHPPQLLSFHTKPREPFDTGPVEDQCSVMEEVTKLYPFFWKVQKIRRVRPLVIGIRFLGEYWATVRRMYNVYKRIQMNIEPL